MKFPSWITAFFAIGPLTSSAVIFSVDAGVLSNADGSAPMPSTGIVVLTVARDGDFHGPSGNLFATGDEIELARWNLETLGGGLLSDITPNLAFADFSSAGFTWDEGDPLRLYWYPDLTLADAGPAPGISYGFYSDPIGLDGGDPWITPGETEARNLRLFTADLGGSSDSEAGWASHTVPTTTGGPAASVPDGGSCIFLMSLGLAGIAVVQRLRDRSVPSL
jgi:hypothetical protein